MTCVFTPPSSPGTFAWLTIMQPAVGSAEVSGQPARSHRLDLRIDHAPLARPVFADSLTAMDVAAIHPIGPGDIISERAQHAIYVSCVKAIIDAFKNFNVIIHRVSPYVAGYCIKIHMHIYINLNRCKG